jgi:protein-L-isoaspartate(D-aspartate) O-methyltransferase
MIFSGHGSSADRRGRSTRAGRDAPGATGAAFVPHDQVHLAYHDVPVPIPHSQVTTQPSLSAPDDPGAPARRRRARA